MTTAVWTFAIRNDVSTPETPTGSCNSSTTGCELNSTEQVTTPFHDYGIIPVIGYPGPLFTAIHVGALTSLSLSIAAATILFVYLCGFNGSVKFYGRGATGVCDKKAAPELSHDSVSSRAAAARTKARQSFWKWNVGERLVVYMGVCDLCQGVTHLLDHAYIFHAKENPPDHLCALFALFLHTFVFCQWFMVATTAVGACSLIVFGRKMSLGRFDWRLFVFAFGIPTSISATAFSFGLLGASGAWCYIKYGAPSWRLYTQIVNTLQISSYGFVGVSYGAIWIKIQRTTKLMKGSTTERYQSSAKVMMVFVAVFILQWWPYTLFNVWSIFEDPPPIVCVIAVIIVNLGGIYNGIAYTIIRRKLQRQKRQNAVVSCSGDNITKTTDATSSGVTPRIISPSRPARVLGGSHVPEDQDAPSEEVVDDPGVALLVTEPWSAPFLPDSDPGKAEDFDRIQTHIHI